ncbi:hypothetical protein GOV05_05740 [Candidatus Woesearchaeota archaeon]|nr:hypothetical protein [Candidatus Woesearchaeota archaeon]
MSSQQEVFDRYRPFNDDEVKPKLEELIKDEEFLELVNSYISEKLGVLGFLSKMITPAYLRLRLVGIDDVHDLQSKIMIPEVEKLIDKTTSGFSVSGLENIDKDKNYLFIENHINILGDATFLCYGLFQNGFDVPFQVQGDNLHERRIAEYALRLNKAISFPRSIEAGDLSPYSYINSVIEEEGSVWIAQSPGRSKDGNYRTHPGIIKNLVSAKKRDSNQSLKLEEYLIEHPIVPVSISYEYLPTDGMIAQEAVSLAKFPKRKTWRKPKGWDEKSMALDIQGYKGKVSLVVGTPLVEGFSSMKGLIDEINRQIHDNLTVFDSNIIAYRQTYPELAKAQHQELYNLTNRMTSMAKEEEFNDRIKDLDGRHREVVLKLYAKPVFNKLNLS